MFPALLDDFLIVAGLVTNLVHLIKNVSVVTSLLKVKQLSIFNKKNIRICFCFFDKTIDKKINLSIFKD